MFSIILFLICSDPFSVQTMMKHELTKKPEHSSNRDGSLDKLQSLTTLFGR